MNCIRGIIVYGIVRITFLVASLCSQILSVTTDARKLLVCSKSIELNREKAIECNKQFPLRGIEILFGISFES